MVLALHMEDGPLGWAAPSENSSLWIKNLNVNGIQAIVWSYQEYVLGSQDHSRTSKNIL